MDDERKKRKNKKKKNKQGKTASEVTPCIGEVINADQHHLNVNNHVLEISGSQNDVVKTNVEGPCTNSTQGSVSGETGKLNQTDREANLEKAIERLQEEKSAYMLKEACLGETIAKLQLENDIHIQEQVSLLEKNKQLKREHDLWIEKEKSAKGTIASMGDDNQKLRTQVTELEESRNSLLQENLRLKEITTDLQSQIQNLEKASGNGDLNTQLEAAQELVAKLVAENSELVEKVNNLYVELDRQGIPGVLSADAGSEIPTGTASSIHMNDPISEHIEPSFSSGDKMTSLGNVVNQNESNDGYDVNAKNTIHLASSMSESNERANLSSKMTEPLEDIAIEAKREVDPYVYREDGTVIPILPDSLDSEEIVQIPLDENETANLASQPNNDDQMPEEIPLTDAPIIGAPFRFISFMARYVSGADLVHKKSSVN